ncbi:MAG: lipopolysaccharide kinase InaA family protein [Candidatus Binatia bacterium]
MFEAKVWGDAPAGFRRLPMGRNQVIMIREGLESLIHKNCVLQGDLKKEESPFYGRDKLYRLRLENGETAVIRHYRHGGLIRFLSGDVFFSWPPRPFKELAITEEVRRRGIPTLEILAAWIEKLWGPFYRGWLVTRELRGADDLWAARQSCGSGGDDGGAVLRAAARSLRRMHRQGIYHKDLNLKNILIRREAEEIRSYIIDFDKARLFPAPVPSEKSRKNLKRLYRSVCKLDSKRYYFSEEDWSRFMSFYEEAGEG